MPVSPATLSRELRRDRSPELTRRRWAVGLSFVGVGAGVIVGLYQMGMLRRLPDPPLDIFDSTKVDASDYAYKRAQTPDALLMVVSYGVTAVLAGAGGKNRFRDNPALPVAAFSKALYDVGVALKLGQEEWAENRALCFYCQMATLASIATAALAAPEAIRALQGYAASARHDHVGRGYGREPMRRSPRPVEPYEVYEPDADWDGVPVFPRNRSRAETLAG